MSGGTRRRTAVAAWILGAVLCGCGAGERTFDGERAWDHLVSQVEAGPRVPGSEGHRRALGLIRDHLEGRADRVTLHTFETTSPLDSSRITLHNVIAVFGAEHGPRYLFGAHWDTRPVADQEEEEELRKLPVPGANDGASGVAVLLEVAEALARNPPRVGVDLVFFDGEDSGVPTLSETFALGAQRFVKDHPDYRPALVVILDMVGREGATFAKEANSLTAAPWAVESVWRTAREAGLTCFVDSVGPATYDDHIPFLLAGIPAVDIIDRADPAWHTTRDLPSGCSPVTLEQIGRLVLALVARAEADAQRP